MQLAVKGHYHWSGR